MRPSTLKKQQKIIDVATQLFFEQGYAETSLDQIIEVCGGSKQTLYSYFGCKRGILIEVVTRCTEQVGTAFQFNSEADLTEQLNQFGYEYLKVLCSQPIIDIYRIIVTESRRDKELVDFFLSRGPHRFYQMLSDFLQTQASLGRLNIENPAQASSQLIGLVRGDYYQDVVLGLGVPSDEEIKQYSAQAIKIFLQGCRV